GITVVAGHWLLSDGVVGFQRPPTSSTCGGHYHYARCNGGTGAGVEPGLDLEDSPLCGPGRQGAFRLFGGGRRESHTMTHRTPARAENCRFSIADFRLFAAFNRQSTIDNRQFREWATVLADYWTLTKPEVNFLILISTLAGFYLGSSASTSPFRFLRL